MRKTCWLRALRTTVNSDMQPVRAAASELQQKNALARANRKASSSSQQNLASIQIVHRSLLVKSGEGAYLFNCHEGFQRVCNAKRIKLANVENVFVTSMDWSKVSGILGLSLTLQELGASNLCLRAADGINGMFLATKNFMQYFTGMKCEEKTYRDGQYSDADICINPILIEYKPRLFGPKLNQRDVYSHRTRKRSKSNPNLVAYNCSLTDLPGSIDPEKCRKLDVPFGPLLRTIKAGKNIQLPDGRVIKPEDISGPKLSGPRFLIIDCPHENYINSLATNLSLSEIRDTRQCGETRQLDMLIHLTPESVRKNSDYLEWMNGFPPGCKHLVLKATDSGLSNLVDIHRHQYLLQQLDSEIFRPLYLSEQIMKKVEAERCSDTQGVMIQEVGRYKGGDEKIEFKVQDIDRLGNIIELSSLDKVSIRPARGLETPLERVWVDPSFEEVRTTPDFEKYLKELRDRQKSLPKPKDHEPELVFLGTGSSKPGKVRNTSCILLNFSRPSRISVILDCGEDSLGQMRTLYGPAGADAILKSLRLIYVSHHHADHHIGLIRLLAARKKLTNEPVTLLIPPGIDLLLDFHNENFEDLSGSYQIFLTKSLVTRPVPVSTRATIEYVKSDLYESLGGFLDQIDVVHVDHCFNSCGVVMRFKIGHPEMEYFTVAYSGDARPSLDLMVVGENCDLLIHEATFHDKSESDAILKKHSTTKDAIMVGKQMGAKFTILTHFSQRLPKIPYFTENFDDKVGFAFDNLCLKCPTHFNRLPILKPLLGLIFKESLELIDQQVNKIEQKQKLLRMSRQQQDK